MSKEYDDYLVRHKLNVSAAFMWIQTEIPEVLAGINEDLGWQINFAHDLSKDTPDEYKAYDDYFYGKNKSYAVVQAFNYAWLKHIHRNPHHWQHWILINDDPGEGTVIMDMPDNYIVEMICDWWAFSWTAGDLTTMFKWYDEHKEYMQISDKTRKKVENILDKIKQKLEEKK